MNDMQAKLESDLNELALLREMQEVTKTAKREMIENVQQSDEFKRLDDLIREGDGLIASAEKRIRDAALALYEESCELPARVTVKMFSVVAITDEQKAKERCIDHFTPALKLDAKTFEKAAKDGNIPAELATVTKEARAQIATKL